MLAFADAIAGGSLAKLEVLRLLQAFASAIASGLLPAMLDGGHISYRLRGFGEPKSPNLLGHDGSSLKTLFACDRVAREPSQCLE